MSVRHKVLATRRLPEAVEAQLMRDYDATLRDEDVAFTAPEFLEAAKGKDALIVTLGDPLDGAVIAQLPESVRILANVAVGVDHIDMDACRKRGLIVTNTPDVLTEATAEIALLLMLGAARRATEGIRLLHSGAWLGWAPTQLMGRELRGRRLGIFGMGRIGRAVAGRARSFGVKIHYHNRRRLPPAQEGDAAYHDTLGALLSVSDALTIHVTATAETRGLIDSTAIARLPKGAILINTARGDIVDDESLIAALTSGQIAAAGLDVFRGEPDFDRRYLDLPNVFGLPHLGSATVETRTAMGMRALYNLDAFFAGHEPPDQVD